MSSVVRRPNGWEIRESVSTDRGPRSRTLATFRRLDGSVLDHAASRASKELDRGAVIRAALRAGAPVEPAEADAHAARLVGALARGAAPRPGLRRLLSGLLDRNSSEHEGIAEWIGSSPEQRAAALVDLLLLADALPAPAVAERPSFPGFRRRDA